MFPPFKKKKLLDVVVTICLNGCTLCYDYCTSFTGLTAEIWLTRRIRGGGNHFFRFINPILRNSANHMDKKTTGLAKSYSRPRSFFDDDDDDDEQEPHSFDFRPSRSHQYVTLDPTRFRVSSSSSFSTEFIASYVRFNGFFGGDMQGRSSIADIDSLKDTGDRIGAPFVAALIHEIDGKIKEHMDTLLHAVGGLNARVTQVETRTRQLEDAVDELKDSVEFNGGRTEGKLRDLHNILEEVFSSCADFRSFNFL